MYLFPLLLDAAILFAVVMFVITQGILPLMRGEALFPYFKKTGTLYYYLTHRGKED